MHRSVEVNVLLEEDAGHLQLVLVAGQAGLDRTLDTPRIQKPGLALTGFVDFVHAHRLQILGSTELAYLHSMEKDARREALSRLFAKELACIVCTKGMDLPTDLVELADKTDTALLTTPQITSVFIDRVEAWLGDRLAPTTVMHGVLLEVFGVGVLILGKSGIGKSEAALDLLLRGHRLVADDIVRVRRRGAELLYGTGEPLLRHHMELRGLGLLNVKELMGVTSVREKKRIDLVAELVAWSDDEEYDRLGLEERRFPILDVELPLLTIPVRPGRTMGAIIEIAARNQLLKSMGVHTARDFGFQLEQTLAPGRRTITDDVD